AGLEHLGREAPRLVLEGALLRIRLELHGCLPARRSTPPGASAIGSEGFADLAAIRVDVHGFGRRIELPLNDRLLDASLHAFAADRADVGAVGLLLARLDLQNLGFAGFAGGVDRELDREHRAQESRAELVHLQLEATLEIL